MTEESGDDLSTPSPEVGHDLMEQGKQGILALSPCAQIL